VTVQQIFPAGDGATPALLDVDLSAQLQDWRDHHPRQRVERRLVLHKSRRRLDVFAGPDPVKVYLVNLGRSPEGAAVIDERREDHVGREDGPRSPARGGVRDTAA